MILEQKNEKNTVFYVFVPEFQSLQECKIFFVAVCLLS